MSARASLAFYWRLVELFRDDPGPWTFAWAQWSIRASIAGSLPLTVGLECATSGAARDPTLVASVDVKAGTTLAVSRAAARELAPLARLLSRRGYEVRPAVAFYPLVAHRPLAPRAFASERRFLAALAGASPGAPSAHPRSTLEFADAFRGRRSGAWGPSLAAWEWRRPIRVAGSAAVAALTIHVAPAPGGRLGAASSVTLWPPWEGRGPFPAWLAAARRVLDLQLRAMGHAPEWHRGPDGRGVVVTAFREGLRGARAVAAARRRLEAGHLGDP